MKIVSRVLSFLVITSAALLYMSCDKEKGTKKTEEEIQLEKLSRSWNLVSVSDDNGPREDFTNVVLTISGTAGQAEFSYSLTGTRPTPSPWPASGKWKFGANVTKDIIRDPGTQSEIAMEYEVSESSLTITFTLPDGAEGWEGGRTGSVTGNWTFIFAMP